MYACISCYTIENDLEYSVQLLWQGMLIFVSQALRKIAYRS